MYDSTNAQPATNSEAFKADLVAMFTDQVKNIPANDKYVYRTELGKIVREFAEYEAAGEIQTGDLPRDVAEKIYSMKKNAETVIKLHAAGKTSDAAEVYRTFMLSGVTPVALTALPDELAKSILNLIGSRVKVSSYNLIPVH